MEWRKGGNQSFRSRKYSSHSSYRKTHSACTWLFTQPIQIIKLLVLLNYLPLFLVIYLIPIDFLRQQAARVLLFVLGVYNIEDYSLEKAEKGNKVYRILSNHSCFLDIVYYLYRWQLINLGIQAVISWASARINKIRQDTT